MLRHLFGIIVMVLSLFGYVHAADRLNNTQVSGDSTFTDKATGMEFVNVKKGCFRMGDTIGDGYDDEDPLHEVCVDGFSMGKYTVTVGEFRKFVSATGYRTEAEKGSGCFTAEPTGKWAKISSANWKNPGFSQTDRHPVVCISWNDATGFINWLTRQSNRTYRLPTEAELEYAARGGTNGRNYWGNSPDDACKFTNVSDRTAKAKFPKWPAHDCNDGYLYTAPVGSFRPNAFGLYDMMGNVWQWAGDWYGESYYGESPKNNPQGPSSGTQHVPRGGSWRSSSDHVRASLRTHPPSSQSAGVGFRLVSPVNQVSSKD